jgi:leucyl/phenylalanyl-tRNA--protein transferase
MGLVDAMISSNMTLLDVQWLTPHLQSLGVIELPRTAYLDRLSQAISP